MSREYFSKRIKYSLKIFLSRNPKYTELKFGFDGSLVNLVKVGSGLGQAQTQLYWLSAFYTVFSRGIKQKLRVTKLKRSKSIRARRIACLSSPLVLWSYFYFKNVFITHHKQKYGSRFLKA